MPPNGMVVELERAVSIPKSGPAGQGRGHIQPGVVPSPRWQFGKHASQKQIKDTINIGLMVHMCLYCMYSIYIYICKCMYIYIYICVCVIVCVCDCVCVCMFVRMYIFGALSSPMPKMIPFSSTAEMCNVILP